MPKQRQIEIDPADLIKTLRALLITTVSLKEKGKSIPAKVRTFVELRKHVTIVMINLDDDGIRRCKAILLAIDQFDGKQNQFSKTYIMLCDAVMALIAKQIKLLINK